MNNRQHNQIIGLGVYTLQEASLYGGISVNKLSRWIFGAINCVPIIDSQLRSQHLVSFYDLVQAMAINKAREEDVSLQKIREAICFAQNEYGVKLPLAYNHRLLLFDRDLHIELPNRKIVQASGRAKGQTALRQIVEPFIKDLRFDAQGLAHLLTPFSKYKRTIVLDPSRQFGLPLVEKSGYRADILEAAFRAEGSYELVASGFNIDVKDVKIAVDYMDSRRKRKAA